MRSDHPPIDLTAGCAIRFPFGICDSLKAASNRAIVDDLLGATMDSICGARPARVGKCLDLNLVPPIFHETASGQFRSRQISGCGLALATVQDNCIRRQTHDGCMPMTTIDFGIDRFRMAGSAAL